MFLNGNGDYLDLRNVIDPSQMPDFDKMSKDELTQWVRAKCIAVYHKICTCYMILHTNLLHSNSVFTQSEMYILHIYINVCV